MGMLGKVLRSLSSRARGSASPEHVRALIDRNRLDEARAALEQLVETLPDAQAQRFCLIGEIAYKARQDAEAEVAFRAALKYAPGLAGAHYGLSLMLAEATNFDAAVRHAQFAVGAAPDDARFHAQLGYCHMGLGNFEIAETPLRRATVLDPLLPHAWNNLGIIMRLRERREEAADCFRKALELRPGFAQATENLAAIADMPASEREALTVPTVQPPQSDEIDEALALERDGELDAAIAACELLMLRDDEVADAASVEAMRLYGRSGDHAGGMQALQAFLARRPDSPHAITALGVAALEALDYKTAEVHLRGALKCRPDDVRVLTSLSLSLTGQERFAEGVVYARRAAELAPDHPKVLGALGSVLFNACLYEEARHVCERLLAMNRPAPYYGSVLGYLERFDEALAALDLEVARVPSDPNPRFQRAQIRLLMHDFEQGWDDYALRGLSYSKNFRVLPFPQWQGEPLPGKRIVVLAEQGLGDQVMFASCLPDLLALGPRDVIVEAIDRIAPTLQRSFPSCKVIATRQNREMQWVTELQDVDYFVPLGDLPAHFRRSRSAFPQRRSFLVPDPVRVAHWRCKLQERGPGPHIGVSWRGGTEVTRTSLRSMTAVDLLPLAAARPANWVCLQYGKIAGEVEAARAAGLDLAWWPEGIADLDEFAALVSALDLVITVCNTTVHYAGGCGTPVWVLAPKVPEWRYGLRGDSLPWYPSARMFRQDEAGAWTGPMKEVRRSFLDWQPVPEHRAPLM